MSSGWIGVHIFDVKFLLGKSHDVDGWGHTCGYSPRDIVCQNNIFINFKVLYIRVLCSLLFFQVLIILFNHGIMEKQVLSVPYN